MRARASMLLLAAGLLTAAFATASGGLGARPPATAACTVDGPRGQAPAVLAQVRLGMSLVQLEALLGRADHSPVDGQHVFSTAGRCPMEGSGRSAPCAVVAEFRAGGGTQPQVMAGLQSCWWGAVGE